MLCEHGNMAPCVECDIEPLRAENEKLLKDAERYRYIREGGHWIVASTQTGVHLDGEELDDLIDGEIADAMPAALPQVPDSFVLAAESALEFASSEYALSYPLTAKAHIEGLAGLILSISAAKDEL